MKAFSPVAALFFGHSALVAFFFEESILAFFSADFFGGFQGFGRSVIGVGGLGDGCGAAGF